MLWLWINLDSSVDRHKHMTAQFEKILSPDDECHRIPAVSVPRHRVRGCSMSHRKAIQQGHTLATRHGKDHFVVCEDNLVFKGKIDWHQLIASAPDDWEILQLLCSDPKFCNDQCEWVPHIMAHAAAKIYVIKTASALKITKNMNVSKDADRTIYQGGITYLLTSPVCGLEPLPSTIARWHNKLNNMFIKGVPEKVFECHPFLSHNENN
jgi:GR25 family glycosyltransferase involved in LPS biosynthesis